MNKRVELIALTLFLFVCLLLPVGWAIAIDWIQSDERAVGEGHPTYTDVVNRPAKQIWGVYTSEHNIDGTHKPEIFPTPLPTPTPWPDSAIYEFALGNTGSTFAAQAIFSNVTSIWDTATYTMAGIVDIDRLDTAESIFKRYQSLDSGVTYDTLVFDLHKTSDNRLGFSVRDAGGGTRTYTSGQTVFSSALLHRPVEVGIMVDQTTPQISFLYDGYAEPFQNTSSLYPAALPGDQLMILQGFQGAMALWRVQDGLTFPADNYHEPVREGLSLCARCVLYYDFDDAPGDWIDDKIGSLHIMKTNSPDVYWDSWGQDY